MTSTLTDVDKINRLPWLVGAQTLNIVFVLLTFSGTVFVLFLDELGLDDGQIGILLAIVPFLGIIAPFVAPIVSRFGYKRTYVTFWGIRNFVIAFLLLTPAVLDRYGTNGAFIWVAVIILFFGACRAIAETGGYPWKKEVVPDNIRGKYTAVNSMSTTVASILVIVVAGYVIESLTGLSPFMILIAIGIAFGLLSVIAFARVPAEDRQQRQSEGGGYIRQMNQAVHSKNFVLFLVILGLATIGGRSVISFVPLFMKEQVGLSEGVVVLLSVGTFIGALVTSFLWGWAADRYGSKPVMQLSLYSLLLLPVAWILLPQHSVASAPLAMAIAVVAGIATLAWQISWTRYLFVNAVPEGNKSAYLAVFYAWFAIVAGLGPFLAGQILSASKNLETQIWRLSIGPYTPLFVLSFILILIGAIITVRLQTEGTTTFRHFAGMFLRGNPVKAMRLLVQYNFSGDEMTRVVATEQMGDAQSLLSTNELIEALRDPSFRVRQEAIHSIGRMPAEDELVDALIEVLADPESELNISVARALGRIGSSRAVPALREALLSGYRPLEANSARSLAMLDDQESVPQIMAKLQQEPNPRLRLAYVSALGRLRVEGSIEQLFDLLYEARSEVSRGEIGLAIARIVGDEKYYLQHWRSLRSDLDTSTAQALLAFQKPAERCGLAELAEVAEASANSFAAGDSDSGVTSLATMLQWLPSVDLERTTLVVSQGCIAGLREFGNRRTEYILLSLHTLDTAFKQLNP
ncbi:MAG: MFS transporter [Chloroflexota bacterium]|nr:MAG: MFS transporter [Chloroflexota bacterium]